MRQNIRAASFNIPSILQEINIFVPVLYFNYFESNGPIISLIKYEAASNNTMLNYGFLCLPLFCCLYPRHTLRGLHQLVFYQLPHFGDFYAQLTNMLALDADPREERPVRVLYTCLDALRLAKVVGTQHARKILESPKHLFVV